MAYSEAKFLILKQEILEELNEYLPWHVTDRIENDALKSSSIVVCIRCRGKPFTEKLPSNDRRDTHTDTETDGKEYAVEMGSGSIT
jgi:hypothetical protein